mmetsp:Transcript_21866/g.38674  ORF Transcript_21866/g.38674 Transcript_21866/m.38674 type:complete len:445 (-) Transcript_21866:1228-2562(-)
MAGIGSAVLVALMGIGGAVAVFGLRPLLFAIMRLYKKANVYWLKLRGLTPESQVENRIVSGQAWDEWCDALKAAGAVMYAPGAPSDPFNQAEGLRYLTRLARVSLEAFMECNDTDAPQLVALANGSRVAPVKLGSDNPDNVYESAAISGRKVYKLTVDPGSVHYLGFGTQKGSYGGEGGLKTVDYKEVSEFEREEDGSIIIMVCNERPKEARNWLKTVPDPERGLLIVRQTREDHENEILAKVKIECVGGNKLPAPCSASAVDDALRTSALLVAGAPLMFAKWADEFKRNHCNELPLFDVDRSNAVGGDPFIRYYHSYWQVEHDEALIIRAMPPKDLASWNFQLNNHWMESLDYRYHRIHVNRHTATYLEDGSICIVVTNSDPSTQQGANKWHAYDWLTTTGHTCGTMCFRWLRPGSFENLPQPTTKLVKLSDLDRHLDASEGK